MDIAARLLAGSVQDGDCRIWQGCRSRAGYGKIAVRRRTAYAHRASYEIHNGAIPEDAFVLHRCDRPACIAPAHLFVGDHSANMRDMSAKGRGRGQKLTPAMRDEIRAVYATGLLTQRALASQYGVAVSLINRVVKG